MLRAVGIDLGTSKTVAAALCQGRPQLLRSRDGSPLVPSLLSLGPGGELLHGHAARERMDQAIASFKPRLGLPGSLAFNGLDYSPAELAALLLARLKEDAEAALGEPVGRAVLAAPLAFGQQQVAALRQAARMAGFFVLSVIRDPIAAALAYSVAHPQAEPRTLLVFDLGGGCLDVAVLRLFHGALAVLGQAGENWLGGDDLTESLVAHLLRRLQGERALLLDETRAARKRLRGQLRRAAEQAKVALSTVEGVNLFLPPEALDLPTTIDEGLAREQFEEMIRPRLEEAMDVVERALAAGGLSGESVDSLLLVGGSSQIPLLQALLADRLRRAHVLAGFNPLTGVALGAAVRAGLLQEVECPTCGLHSPLEAQACRRCGSPLAGQPRLACRRCFLPNDPGRRACWKCGASLRAARLALRARRPADRACPACGAPLARGRPVCGACHAPLAEASPRGLRCSRCQRVQPAGAVTCPACDELIAPFIGSVSSRDVGIEQEDGRMDVVLPQGQGLPTARPACRLFRAAEEGQQHLDIPIYEGHKPFARQNDCCGRLRIALPEGLAPATPVRIAFSFDPDGALEVGAALADGSGQEVDAWLEWESA